MTSCVSHSTHLMLNLEITVRIPSVGCRETQVGRPRTRTFCSFCKKGIAVVSLTHHLVCGKKSLKTKFDHS